MSLRIPRTRNKAISPTAKEEIGRGTGILPVIPNRQAGRRSHHSLLAIVNDTVDML